MARSRLRLALTALGAAAAVAAGTAATPATAAEPRPRVPRYVALGDSFTSGPSIPRQVNARCGRSDANYPSIVREELGIADRTSFTDASCGGATTDHMWNRQGATGNDPQLDAISRDTSLVTLGIGGNDIGFGEIIGRCIHPLGPVESIPRDNPCQRYFTRNGVDELDKRVNETAPKVAAVLKAVHERAPHARVAVVGYPALLGDDIEGCRKSVRIADGDIPYLRGTLRRLNAMLRKQATDRGDLYVNTNATTADHDACQPFEERFVEGLYPRPSRPAVAFHPNAGGERAMAEAVVDTIIFGPSAR
ncbi:SGNH/GDSL hydrolase family protein [Streptomyces ehimensis]|uniref:SGNH/GDSL hydrolase family protein n=1 Tax=Streptomyces ehimensis TaxID=68195 RepID=A0ABV9BU05_9ACTN